MNCGRHTLIVAWELEADGAHGLVRQAELALEQAVVAL